MSCAANLQPSNHFHLSRHRVNIRNSSSDEVVADVEPIENTWTVEGMHAQFRVQKDLSVVRPTLPDSAMLTTPEYYTNSHGFGCYSIASDTSIGSPQVASVPMTPLVSYSMTPEASCESIRSILSDYGTPRHHEAEFSMNGLPKGSQTSYVQKCRKLWRSEICEMSGQTTPVKMASSCKGQTPVQDLPHGSDIFQRGSRSSGCVHAKIGLANAHGKADLPSSPGIRAVTEERLQFFGEGNQYQTGGTSSCISETSASPLAPLQSGRVDRRIRFNKSRWWERSLDKCPISDFPIRLLPYPPFKCRVQGKVTLIDGKYLLLKTIADWNFAWIGGQAMSSEVMQNLDQHVRRCKLSYLRIGIAMELSLQDAPKAVSEFENVRAQAAQELKNIAGIQAQRSQNLPRDQQVDVNNKTSIPFEL